MRKFKSTACLVRYFRYRLHDAFVISLYHLSFTQQFRSAEMGMHSIEEIKLKLDQTRVIAVTCLGITSPLLNKKQFDVCIMDEAGQITLPVCVFSYSYKSIILVSYGTSF